MSLIIDLFWVAGCDIEPLSRSWTLSESLDLGHPQSEKSPWGWP